MKLYEFLKFPYESKSTGQYKNTIAIIWFVILIFIIYMIPGENTKNNFKPMYYSLNV